MQKKKYLGPTKLIRDSFRLAQKIYCSEFRPDVILVIWRGGTPVGIVIHEFFLKKGIKTFHTVIKAESYIGIEERSKPKIDLCDHVLQKIKKNAKVLIVDDIYDSGMTIYQVKQILSKKTKYVKSATLYLREYNSHKNGEPDFYLNRTSTWIVFPHELMDLSDKELIEKDRIIYNILKYE